MHGKAPLQKMLRILESPDLVVKSLRQAYRKRLTSRLDYYRSDGYSAPPIQIDLKLTDICNLRCKMCAQWGEVGYNLSRAKSEITRILPLEVYKKVADEMETFRPWIYIWGGEPFLYPDLVPLIEYFKEKHFIVSVVTNGTKVSRHAQRLVEVGLDVLLISVDGPKDTHDNVRGYSGAFDSTVEGVRAIQAEKARRRTVKPYVSFMSVITKSNQDKLTEIYEVGEDLDIDMMLTWYGWYQTQDSGRRHAAILEEKLGVTPWSWKGWLWSVHEIDADVVNASVAELNSRRWSFPYIFFPDLKPHEVPVYYNRHAETFGYKQCRAPWVMCEILPNGDVVTCRDYPDVVTGNITRDSLVDIWNGEKSRAFRILLKNDGLLPICSKCQGLMGL